MQQRLLTALHDIDEEASKLEDRNVSNALRREAKFEIAELLRLGGNRASIAASLHWYREAADLGHPGAQRHLALLPSTPAAESATLLYTSSLGGDVQVRCSALQLFVPHNCTDRDAGCLCCLCFGQAMIAMGYRHKVGGLGVPQDCRAAHAYYEAAAAKVAEEYELRQLDQSTYLSGLFSYLADRDKDEEASSAYRQRTATTDEFFEM